MTEGVEMRTRAFCALAAVAALGACSPRQELGHAERARITEEVTSVVEDLYAAMNAHDAGRVLAHYLQTDEFLFVAVNDATQGWAAFSRLVGPWYASHADVTFEHQLLHVQVLSAEVATVTVRGSSTEAPHLMWTHTLVLRDGVWLVALEHESWPGAEAPGPTHPMG
jgi:ketosteroid isomerase-like protein